MPIYEYKCWCGKTQEKIKKISERDEPVPCSQNACTGFATRVVSAPAYVNGGFYDALPKVK